MEPTDDSDLYDMIYLTPLFYFGIEGKNSGKYYGYPVMFMDCSRQIIDYNSALNITWEFQICMQ